MLLLGAVVILGLIGTDLFELANTARQSALQTEYRDRAVGSVEFDLQAIRQAVTQQFAQQAWLDVGSPAINQTQEHGSKESGYYNLNLEAQAAAPQIFATQTHNGLQALNAPDDPFRGLVALVDTFTVTADAKSTFASDTDSRFTLPTLALTGGTIIVFNLLKAPPGIGRNSFYISSADPDAIVLLINASTLPGDLAIGSPSCSSHRGGFNSQGGRKAACITARQVSGVPIG